MIYDKIAAGRGSPRTPLGELTTLPQTPKLDPWQLANVALAPSALVLDCSAQIMVTLD